MLQCHANTCEVARPRASSPRAQAMQLGRVDPRDIAPGSARDNDGFVFLGDFVVERKEILECIPYGSSKHAERLGAAAGHENTILRTANFGVRSTRAPLEYSVCGDSAGSKRIFMRTLRKYSVILVIASGLLAGRSRPAEAQLWTAAMGGLAGSLSGGYITLSIVVARAQMGHYLHEPHDILDWKGFPVLIGGSTGAALGMWAPDRLGTGFVYGSAGTLAGGTVGFLIGAAVSNRSEGKWAGGAIGAGLGMAIGSTWGVLAPNSHLDPTGKRRTAVPISYQIRF